MAWRDCVFAHIDVSITDAFVLLFGMYFKYMCLNLRRFFIIVRNESILYTYYMYSKKKYGRLIKIKMYMKI